jgi:hypothetical protein
MRKHVLFVILQCIPRVLTIVLRNRPIDRGSIKEALPCALFTTCFPYPSATKLIVESMNQTLVGGDTTFLDKLDQEFVANDLVDYKHVKAAMEKYPGWEKAPGVDPANPYEREEMVKI